MSTFGGCLSPVFKYCGIQQGAVNLPPLPHFTAHYPQRAPSGICVSFHTWCWLPIWSQQSPKTAMLSFTNRCHIRHTDSSSWGSFSSRCLDGTSDTYLDWKSLARIIISMEPLCLIDKQDINNRQMSTVTANWPLIHVLNTMFCEERRDYMTAITLSSGSQCAYRFGVFFSSFG